MHKTAPSYVSNEQKIKKAQTLMNPSSDNAYYENIIWMKLQPLTTPILNI